MVIDIRIFKLWSLETIIFTNAFLQYNKLILQKFKLVDQTSTLKEWYWQVLSYIPVEKRFSIMQWHHGLTEDEATPAVCPVEGGTEMYRNINVYFLIALYLKIQRRKNIHYSCRVWSPDDFFRKMCRAIIYIFTLPALCKQLYTMQLSVLNLYAVSIPSW